MRFLKLRIAFSATCLIACVLLIAVLACNRETPKAVRVAEAVPEMEPDTETKGTFADQLPSWDEIATVDSVDYSLIGKVVMEDLPRTRLGESVWHRLGESFRETKPVHVGRPIPVIGSIEIVKRDGRKINISLYETSQGGVVFRAYSGNGSAPYFLTPDKKRIVELLPKR